jgi:hypothetical protein
LLAVSESKTMVAEEGLQLEARQSRTHELVVEKGQFQHTFDITVTIVSPSAWGLLLSQAHDRK